MDFGEQAHDGPIKHSCVWCPSGSFLTCREIVLTSNVGYPCKDRVHWRFEDGTEAPPRDRSPKRQGSPGLLHTSEQHFDNPEDLMTIADAQRRKPEDRRV
jgi:hypothetical protein